MENIKKDEILKKKYTFDQYGRYSIIKNIIDKNRINNEKLKVLDVGGRGNNLRDFLPKDNVFYLDPNVDSNDDNFIEGNGCEIPLKDNSFDWVVSGDVFEHISREDREIFLSENIRVARRGVVLSAPFYSKEIQKAEVEANKKYKEMTGENHEWLEEHITNGLPRKKEVEKFLKNKKYNYQTINNNILFIWKYIIDIELMAASNYSIDVKKKLEELNLFYNTNIFPIDHTMDSYRKIYFIKKDKKQKNITLKNVTIFKNELFLELFNQGLLVIYEINKNITQKTKEMGQHIINIEAKNKILLKHDKKRQDEIGELKKEIVNMKHSKFWKLRNIYVRFGPRKWAKIPRRIVRVLRRDGPIMFIKKLGYIFYFKGHIPQQYPEYQKWIKVNEKYNQDIVKKEIDNFKYKPKISVIVPVYNVEPRWLNKCIGSVMNQYYDNWELCLYDDASTNKKTIKCLKKWQAKNDPRIKIGFGKKNQHISKASNEALKMATGKYIILLDNDDELSPFAFYENVKLLNKHPEADFIYSDEDKIDTCQRRKDPFFKPNWSPELMLSQMYTCHLGFYRKSIIDEIGGFRKGYEGAQDYDLVLRFIEKTDVNKIFHIPKILYHWRTIKTSTATGASAKDYAHEAAKKSINSYIKRNKIQAEVIDGPTSGTQRVKYKILGNPLISIIIPLKDQIEVLKKCINSIFEETEYKNYEIILVDNLSKEKKTKKYLEEIEKDPRIRVYKYNKIFNYSAINNFAVDKASGKYTLLLNNDTEVLTGEWLSAMLEQAQKEGVGAVGAKLLFPNGRIQHAGVIMGMGIAGHAFKGFFDEDPNYFRHADIIKNYSGVTAACLMTRKDIYEKIGGLNEKNLKIAYNDVDFCLRLIEGGYRVVYTPYAKLYHYESFSRGYDYELKKTNPREYKRIVSEIDFMNKKWKKIIKNDPYYSPNLTKKHENFSINTDFKK